MGVTKKLFGKYLLVTNTVSCGLMMGAGDMIQQRSEHWRKHYSGKFFGNSRVVLAASLDPEDAKTSTSVSVPRQPYEHDYSRMRNMMVVGLLQGPFHHWFYSVLERFFPGRGGKAILKKTCLDQSIASPTCLGIFFIGLAFMESRNFEEIRAELKLKLLDTWKVDCCFWPPIQFVNFMFIPLHYRVLYANFMTMIYDIFLSYMKYDSHYE